MPRLRAEKGDSFECSWSKPRRLFDKNPRPSRRAVTSSRLCYHRRRSLGLSRRRRAAGVARGKAKDPVGGQRVRWRRCSLFPLAEGDIARHSTKGKSSQSTLMRLQGVQGSKPHRTHVQQAQTVQAHRNPLRQNQALLCWLPGSRRSPNLAPSFCQRSLDQPAFNRNRLSAEKWIVSHSLEQLSASNWTRVALSDGVRGSSWHLNNGGIFGEHLGYLLEQLLGRKRLADNRYALKCPWKMLVAIAADEYERDGTARQCCSDVVDGNAAKIAVEQSTIHLDGVDHLQSLLGSRSGADYAGAGLLEDVGQLNGDQ